MHKYTYHKAQQSNNKTKENMHDTENSVPIYKRNLQKETYTQFGCYKKVNNKAKLRKTEQTN